jgi:hypothetical protein
LWASIGLAIILIALALDVLNRYEPIGIVFSAAAWIVWEERTASHWRIPVAAVWLLSVPYVNSTGLALPLNR